MTAKIVTAAETAAKLDARRRQREQRPAQSAPSGLPFTDLGAALDGLTAARDWRVSGLLEGAPLVVLSGPEKAGKSWLAMALAMAVATGTPFAGRCEVLDPGLVLYLDAENGGPEFARRIARIARGMGIDPRESIHNIRHLYTRGHKLARGANDSFLDKLLKVADHEKPRLIVADSLYRLFDGSMNDAGDMVEAMQVLSELRRLTNAPCIALHHLNKQGGFLGSRALPAAADLFIEGSDDEEPWFASKGRTLRKGDLLAKRFCSSARHVDDDDDSKAATILSLRFEGEQKGKAGLSALAVKIANLVEAQDGLSTWQLRKKVNRSAAHVNAALAELEESGRIERRGKTWTTSTTAFFKDLHEGVKTP